MLQVMIAVMIALSTGTACDLGEEVNWYDWAKGEGQSAKIIMRAEPTDNQDAWLFQEADGDYLLFVFREKISDTLDAGRSDPHGECSVLIKAN